MKLPFISMIHLRAMQTCRSSKSPSISDVDPTVPLVDPAADPLRDPNAQCMWSAEEDKCLIVFLCNNKDKQVDGGNFRGVVWTDAARHMALYHKRGGVKTVKVCQSKYAQVYISFMIFKTLTDHSSVMGFIQHGHHSEGALWIFMGC
jgi:hypothetical protein